MQDFVYIDTAFGDVRNRNHVIRVDKIHLPDPPVECYISMFRFRQEFKKHVEKTGSVKGNNDMPCYLDRLWFDIDDEGNLEQARRRTMELVTRIENEFGIVPLIYFSGYKGFHVGIPSESFNAQPRPDLPRVFKEMARRIAGDIPIDTSIYEKNRLWRMANTINAKSGLFKIPLTIEELAQYDAESIKKLASAGRDIGPDASASSLCSNSLEQMYNSIVDKFSQSLLTVKKTKSGVDPDVKRFCIEKLFEGSSSGQRNEAGIRLAVFFKQQGHSEEETLSRLVEWNHKNNPSLEDCELQTITRSAYTGEYEYGCNDPILKDSCNENCLLFKADKSDKPIFTSFRAFPDGTILEMLYDPMANPEPFFAKYANGKVDYVESYHEPRTGKIIFPFKPGKIIQSNTIHFPSRVDNYDSEAGLIDEIGNFIYKYLQLSPLFHNISKYYVLLTWVYDSFTNLPYLRVKGDYGTGKSRFLITVGSLCYKPIFCSGAASVSPIFRLIDTYKGTMIIDESDFTDSDESHRVVKILNSGFQKGFPVLISDVTKSGGYEPTSFDVYGPKLIASRNNFKDMALESRCITEIMEKVTRIDIPINLPNSFWDEARAIRNKLLKWRFEKYGKVNNVCGNPGLPVEPRLAQIMMPLLSIIDDQTIKDEFISFMQDRNRQIIEERGETLDGIVAGVVCRLWHEIPDENIRVKAITEKSQEQMDSSSYKLTPRKVGSILRGSFKLILSKGRDGYYIDRSDRNSDKLNAVAAKFGIDVPHPPQPAQSAQRSPNVARQGFSL